MVKARTFKVKRSLRATPKRLPMQEAINFVKRVALLKETLEQAATEDEPKFDLSKLDQLEDLLDKAKKDIRRPPASIDPKEYWALIVKNLKRAVEELIASEGLDVTEPNSPTFESDLPLPSPDEKPQIEDTEEDESGEEENSLEDFLGSASDEPDIEGVGEDQIGEQPEEEDDREKEKTSGQSSQQESFYKQIRSMFSSRTPLSWKDLTKATFSKKLNQVTQALNEKARNYRAKLRKISVARGLIQEESAANLANGLAYIAAMVKGATVNSRLAKAGEELFQKIQKTSEGPGERIIIPFLKRLGININEESYQKTQIEIPPAIKNKLISLATGDPRAKEALSKAKSMTLDQFSEIAYRIALVSRKKKATNNPDWEKD